jgi:hypothetical protein
LLIDEPRQLEQQTHRLLSAKREGKEWFRCSPEEAVVAVKKGAGGRAIVEIYKRAERANVEAQLQRESREQEIEIRLAAEESAIHQNFQQQVAANFAPRKFWIFWIAGSIAALVVIKVLFPKSGVGGVFIAAAIAGVIVGALLQGAFQYRREHSSQYLELEKRRDAELGAVRAKVISCQSCGRQVRFDRLKVLLAESGYRWNCPSCKATMSPAQW